MKLADYLKKMEISLEQASKELGFSYEDVRRYAKNEGIPRPERLKKICSWSQDEISIADFYDKAEE